MSSGKENVEPLFSFINKTSVLATATDDKKQAQTILEAHGYQIAETLGRGSYAVVKSAYSSRHKTKVAVKIISKKRAPQEYLVKFLPREIDVIKILKHPCLICFLQSIETTNRVYLIMELAENGDLLDAVKEEGYIPEPKAGRWFHQLVDGIDYCHHKGVVHRDIKCENLLLDKRYNLKITDFGFAKSNVFSTRDQQHLSETYCGSYAYACPEILRGIPYDPIAADIWSMGVVLYVMVLGRLPYDDTNLKNLLSQVQKNPDFPPSPVAAEDLKALINKILLPARIRYRIPEIQADPWFRRVDPTLRPQRSTITFNRPTSNNDRSNTKIISTFKYM